MFSTKKRNLGADKIKALYKAGGRDFSNVFCTGGDFQGAKIPGSNFTDANLSFSNFKYADLSGCSFIRANIEWSNFEKADLRRSDFLHANLSWSILNRAQFEKAVLNDTNMSWCMIIDTDIDNAIKKNVDFTSTAFDLSQIKPEGRAVVHRELMKRQGSLPFDAFFEIECIVKTDTEAIKKQNVNLDVNSAYSANTSFGYGSGDAKYGVSVKNPGSYTSDSVSYDGKKKKPGSYDITGSYK